MRPSRIGDRLAPYRATAVPACLIVQMLESRLAGDG